MQFMSSMIFSMLLGSFETGIDPAFKSGFSQSYATLVHYMSSISAIRGTEVIVYSIFECSSGMTVIRSS